MKNIIQKVQKEKISSQDLKLKLEQLSLACDNLNADAAELIVKELLDASFNANVDATLTELHDLVCSFDFDEAIAIIKKLILSLPN